MLKILRQHFEKKIKKPLTFFKINRLELTKKIIKTFHHLNQGFKIDHLLILFNL